MKRIFLSVVVVLLCAALCVPCALAEDIDPLLEQAKALAVRLSELAESDAYLRIISGSESIIEIIEGWRGDYSAPTSALRVTLESGERLLPAMTSVEIDPSDEIADLLTRRLFAVIPSTINAAQGTEALAATSALTTNTAFVCETCDAPALYILTFENGMSVAATFVPYQDGAVIAQATFLAADAEAWSPTLESLQALEVLRLEEIAL